LAGAIFSRVTGAISGLTPSPENYNLYSSRDDASKIYERNTALWLSGVTNLSCIPVYCSSTGPSFNGVLVAPDILIQANHAHGSGTIYFVSDSNIVYSRSVLNGTQIGSTDLFITRLSSPLPNAIVPAKVLPVSAYSGSPRNILMDSVFAQHVLSVYTNQFATLRVGEVDVLSVDFGVHKPADPSLAQWYSPLIGGDSGSPAFVVVDNELVATATWFKSDQSTFSDGPPISDYISDINAAITALGSAYSLTVKDLSAYPTYTP